MNIVNGEISEDIKYFAYYDVLTDIPNRTYFIIKLNEEFNKINTKSISKISLFFIDIDNFLKINQTYGHDFGDMVLKATADRLKCSMQKQQILGRIGSDEFALLMVNCENIDEVKSKSEQLAKLFDAAIEIDNNKIFITISMGVFMFPDYGETPEEIFKKTEIALRNAKNLGKNRCVFFNENMKIELTEKMKIENDLVKAVESNNEFILHYQPLINIDSMEIYGVEALLRWKHPQMGLLTPIHFIDIIEQNGMINKIGKIVLNEACNEIKRLHSLGYGNLCMSVNISENQLEDDSFLDIVKNILENTKIETKYLCLEITERVLINPTKKIIDSFIKLRNMGIKIFIDDFGTKYSSLNYLKNLPVDGIKIDKSFIDEIDSSEKDIIIIKSIVNLAHELNLDVIAEGVERHKQLSCLKNIRCNKIQGYFYSKPVSSGKLECFLDKFNKLWDKKV